MLYPDSLIRQIWILILVVLGVYTCFVTPMRLTILDNSLLFTVIEYLLVILFTLDILVNFRSVDDDDGEDRWYIIAHRYLFGWFLFDVCAVFPFETVLDSDLTNLTMLAKLPRILRLFKIARLIKNKDKIKKSGFFRRLNEFLNLNSSLVKLSSFFFTMFIVTHITGCLWLFLAKYYNYGPNTWVYA